jgi:mono/diheme cytochrome c family protein
MEVQLHSFRICLLLPALLLASTALAADAGNGKRLAEARCVTCHRVGTDRPREVADAPPFEVIAQKYAIDPGRLAFSILEPHPRMSVTLTRRETEDVAAYIGSLAK